jgi:hypothetical protein
MPASLTVWSGELVATNLQSYQKADKRWTRPRLREYLLVNWHRYNAQALCVSLVRAFEFSYEAGANTSTILLAEDGSGLILNPAFEAAVKDPRNFSVKDNLLRLYPELAPCFHPKPSCRIEDEPGSCNVVSAPSTAMAEPTIGEEHQTSLSIQQTAQSFLNSMLWTPGTQTCCFRR